jgi:hypothetical protein
MARTSKPWSRTCSPRSLIQRVAVDPEPVLIMLVLFRERLQFCVFGFGLLEDGDDFSIHTTAKRWSRFFCPLDLRNSNSCHRSGHRHKVPASSIPRHNENASDPREPKDKLVKTFE